MEKVIDYFCGQKNGYSRSITLRNRLIPIGKTKENMEQFLIQDEVKANAYPEIKRLIDQIHRNFIEEALSNCTVDWKPLFEAFDAYQKEKDKEKKEKQKKNLEKQQENARKEVVKVFNENPTFGKLFKDGLFKELLPTLIKSAPEEEIKDKEKALAAFYQFATYFAGFHKNRENMYSAEAKATAISNRIVNENFPKFFANVKLFNYLKREFPNIIQDAEEELKTHLNGKTLEEVFSIDAFNNVLSQSGIDFYNFIIGGENTEANAYKKQGLNEKINLAQQHLPAEEKNKLRGKMVVLYKQILSDRKAPSFVSKGFMTSEEVYESIKRFHQETVVDCINQIKDLYSTSKINDYHADKLYVPAKSLENFSTKVFHRWSILPEGLFIIATSTRNSKKPLSQKQEEYLRKKIVKQDYSFVELQQAYEAWCKKYGPLEEVKDVKNYFLLKEKREKEENQHQVEDDVTVLSEITETFKKFNFSNVCNLQQEKEAATPIKAYLDEVLCLYHHLKLLDYKGEKEKDTSFYPEFNKILAKLSEIVPLYNSVRNFVTKKPEESKKIKLNFDCSSLLSGWGTDYGASEAHIFIDDDKYYLGIINNRLTKDEIDFLQNPKGRMITKVIYDFQKPDNKNTPRLFIRSKGENYAPAVSRYNLPIDSVIDIYDKGLFKTEYRKVNPNVYKTSLIKMIDYFKLGFSRHDSYKHYHFTWKDSSEYNDISEFYADVMNSCYQLKFERINFDNLLTLVEQGKLFLFQIYNKDFSKKSSGSKNLHTLYWENLFSEDNLKNVCLQLNGGAELFWRKASLDKAKVTTHKAGSILVNRTYEVETENGKKVIQTIPEEIYQEIYQYKNKEKKEEELSEVAKEYLNSKPIVYREAPHDIVKNKRFTEDQYFFHCPITMNFKAPGITGQAFNHNVLNVLSGNPDVKIIGLDRGERHLIYLSLINQKGEIELQKTLNLIEQKTNDKDIPRQVDYHEKLVQKEGDRDQARKNWKTIGTIKELKEGYLSAVVHEITSLMVKENAIVVMEDLEYGFKRGRFAVERQIYQKFENMLIQKLNYLVFKDRDVNSPGGVLNAYQLTDKAADVADVGNQSGWLFYVPAAYTSKIDPKTGFVNLFITKGLTNITKKKEFFKDFAYIGYDKQEDAFAFEFDYSEIRQEQKVTSVEDYQKKWKVYTKGERLVHVKKESHHLIEERNPTEELKAVFDALSFNWKNGENLIQQIIACEETRENARQIDQLFRMFNATLQMRNSKSNTDIDYLISPVKAEDGTFFDTREEVKKGEHAKLSIDADANGAYHIALKGLWYLKNDFNRDKDGKIQKITHTQWLKFMQAKEWLK